jgi:hypothetical protein
MSTATTRLALADGGRATGRFLPVCLLSLKDSNRGKRVDEPDCLTAAADRFSLFDPLSRK